MLPVISRNGKISLKHSRSVKNAKFPAFFTFLILLVIAILLIVGKNGDKSSSIYDLLNRKWDTVHSSVRLNPTVEHRSGTDLIWQMPKSPKRVLFLAHGCSGRAANFWDKSPNCPNCIGLPEERLIVLHALGNKFAVLAISSKETCWTLGEERLIIRDLIKWWITEQGLEKLPVFALGASSGGYFVSVLAKELHFNAVAIMIAEGVFSHLDIDKNYPPTLFVHMPKDEKRKHRIERYLVVMKEKGIDVGEVRCNEFPLTPQLFANRIPGVSLNLSEQLFDVFKEKGFIDDNGYMRDDGRAIPWKNAIDEKNIQLPNKMWVNYIQEEMNLAYGYHEMTSLQSQQILDWFESHMK